MVPPAGLEPAACGLGNRRSIHLSYGGNILLRSILYEISWGGFTILAKEWLKFQKEDMFVIFPVHRFGRTCK